MKAIIEMPKGDDRRRHFNFERTGFIDLGLIKDVIPVNNGIMPIDYGYLLGTLNKEEGDEIDVLILSDKILEVGQEIEIEPIALIRREDKDDKVVAVDETKKFIKEWDDIAENVRNLIEEFFSYHHKFVSIDDSRSAKKYIEECRVG